MKSQNPHTGARCEGWNVHGGERSSLTKFRPIIQANDPDVVTVRIHKGQRYELGETVEHVCRDGRLTYLSEWWSECAECGSSFSFYTPLSAKRFEPNRRCKAHRAPGRRVQS